MLKQILTRFQKVRLDEWPYRLHEGQKSLFDFILEPQLQKWTPPASIPVWPISFDLEPWKGDLYLSAEKILCGEWELLGVPWQIDKPWGWDSAFEYQWPLDGNPIGLIRRSPVDMKFIWEVFRLDGLLVLALAGHAGHQKAYERALELWRQLLEAHQPFKGIVYLVCIESVFRVVKCLILNQIFEADYHAEDIDRMWSFLRGQHQWIRRYPSLFSSGNNHRVSELAGLAIIEALIPELPGAQPQSITHELLTHVQGLMHADGVYVEQSLYYQATVMEWLLLVSRVLKSTNVYFPIEPVLGHLSQYLNSMLGEHGVVPIIGDQDDSHVLPMLGASDYIRSVAQAASAALKTSVPFEPQSDLRLTLLGLKPPEQKPLSKAMCFDDGGMSQLCLGNVRVLIDHGELGYERLAAHGHADTLSLWAFRGAQPIWSDFGSYSYADPEWRNWSRSTAAHNTVEMNHQSSSVMLGGFSWKERASAYLLERSAQRIRVAHDGYENRFGVQHIRTVEVLADGIRVVDQLEGEGQHHVRLSYLLGEGLSLDPMNTNHVLNAQGQKIMCFECFDETLMFRYCYGDAGKEGWQSTGYMRKQPAYRLIWEAELELPKRIEIFWRWV